MPLLSFELAMMPAHAHPVPSPGTSHPIYDDGMGRRSASPGTARTVPGSWGFFDEVHECPLPPFPFPPSHDTRIRTTRRRTASSGRAGKPVLRIALVLLTPIVLVTLVLLLALVRPAGPNRVGVLQSCW